ncbi:MAG: EAL domain-containing protein [Sulfuricaulis sp.]|uniref:putative bifunctional diguanylate cyclase/phosphodiesterase n=1 Tax=Sulfuricaulis sp. TaxID=2003553 RepID=UPI0025FF00D3|nr:GGDEF and EAL domain-containing protein [Sulfuricaulis sp.]MCR4345776.1 EAL domain-containing protein [Sulfuricaulis sp.]
MGYSAEELAHMTPLDIKPDFTREKFDSLIAPLWRDDTGRVVFETVHQCKDGSLYPVEVQLHLSRAESPPVFVAIIQDITERMQTMETLRESEASLARAQRIAHLGNWDWNIVTNELHWSDEIYRIFGLTPQQFDATYEAFLSFVHPDNRQSVIDAVNKAMHEKEPYSIDHRIVRPDGTERIVHEQAEVTFDENGKPIRMIGTVQDVTEHRQVQERLHNLAFYDSLTGLPNRQQINDSLSRAMLEAESRDRLVAVMFLDLDRFKNINDTLGHDVGDALLKEVAVRLKASLRPGDSISRLGGDEFILILGNIAHINDVTRVAQKILDQFIPPFRIAGRDLFASPSIGITLYPFDDNNTENLLKNADTAMYHAKSLGRNNFQFYTAELNARAARQLELETGMRRALEREEFVLHYQPLVNMQSGLIVGMEALLRWQHPECGLIPPMEFIPLAEETGLIVPIGEWVLRTACAQVKVWHATGFPALHVAVNLSSKQLQQKDFAEVVKRALGETGLEPRNLDLELTESLLMQDMESAVAILKELKDLGVMISLDDFGTGYSSLSYLKRFPIDFLKIDRSFVKDIAHDRYGAGIVRAIIVMAHTLGMKVIGEGVETSEQLGYLRNQGCDIIQGYFCSEPLATETFTDLLKDWQAIRMGKCSIKKASGAPHKKKGKSTRRSSKKKG